LQEIIATDELTKFFGDVPALAELNLKVPAGVAGFIGSNGAGKTTTINILLGLLKPTNGKAYVFGLDSWDQSYEIRQRLGVLHEKPAYIGNFTGQKYLTHVAKLYDKTNPEQRARQLLKDVGLSEAKERRIKTYSAGMTQRLGLAQALIGDPELVILDEPTANLDPLGRIELLEMIKNLHKERNVNFFISTHILPELERVCDWVSIINEGAIVDQGKLEDLSQKYSANVYRIEVSNPELLVERLSQTKLVEKVWIREDSVYCKVSDIIGFSDTTPQLIAELKLRLKTFQPLQNTLEEIFKATVAEAKNED
jgi:ABC-2 type transport system ATP-binding protein